MSDKEDIENTEEASSESVEEESETIEETDLLSEEDELTQLENKLQDTQEEMLRLRAETENFRKRLSKDKEDSVKFANERLFKDIIPVYDNLIRALEAPDINVKSLKEGVDMIAKQFLSFLEKNHVTPIPSIGEPFDPKFHEVVTQIESADHEEDMIIEEFSKGYSLHGRVLTPARVVTAKKPSTENGESAD